MQVTREWLDQVSDEQGLTRGQQELLKIHLGAPPYDGQMLDDFVARFIEKCRGYRGLTADQKALADWKLHRL